MESLFSTMSANTYRSNTQPLPQVQARMDAARAAEIEAFEIARRDAALDTEVSPLVKWAATLTASVTRDDEHGRMGR